MCISGDNVLIALLNKVYLHEIRISDGLTLKYLLNPQFTIMQSITTLQLD